MKIDDGILSYAERAALQLRGLYASQGFRRFSMSRFEEYDLYARYKDFLVSDRIISFTDLDGRLVALKPDVTLSILRRAPQPEDGKVSRVYYHENVYRAAPGDRGFREIGQTGVECIGEVEEHHVFDTVALALRSLEMLEGDYRLCVSHLGLVKALFRTAGLSESAYDQALGYARAKNRHGMEAFARAQGLDGEGTRRLLLLTEISGSLADALTAAEQALPAGECAGQLAVLRGLSRALEAQGLAGKVRLDFSVVSNMDYYDGLVFQGFLEKLPSPVLSGGQYGTLARKLGKQAGAVGFAVYLDELRGSRE